MFSPRKICLLLKKHFETAEFFRAFHAKNFFSAATTTFFDLKCCFLFLWPTNCSNLMCMNWHKFWCILGSARAKSLGGAYMPPLAWNKLYLSPRGIGLNMASKWKWKYAWIFTCQGLSSVINLYLMWIWPSRTLSWKK